MREYGSLEFFFYYIVLEFIDFFQVFKIVVQGFGIICVLRWSLIVYVLKIGELLLRGQESRFFLWGKDKVFG